MGLHEDLLANVCDWINDPAGLVVGNAVAAQRGAFRTPRTNTRPYVVLQFTAPGGSISEDEQFTRADGTIGVRGLRRATLRLMAYGDPNDPGSSYDLLERIQSALFTFDGPPNLTQLGNIIDASQLPTGEETIEEIHYVDLAAAYVVQDVDGAGNAQLLRNITVEPGLVDQDIPIP